MSLYIPSVDTHLLGQFQIQVMQPMMRRRHAERFPVLYLTDANSSFDFARAICHSLQYAGEVRRHILVGIGYPGESPFVGSLLRCRDLTSQRRPEIPDLPRTSRIERVAEIPEGEARWGGADAFLAFIRGHLVPFIDERYPTLRGDCGYAGHSLGGGLGLHALFSQSDLFNRYLLCSASITYDGDDYGLHEAEEFIASGRAVDAQLDISVGGEEEFHSLPACSKPRFVSSFYRMVTRLRKISGLRLSWEVLPGETHASVWPVAFTHGLRRVYEPGEILDV